MTPEMFDAVAAIAQHCCKTHHWVKTPKGPVHIRAPLSKKRLEGHLTAGGQGVGLCPMSPGSSTTRLALLDFDSHKGEVPWDAMRARAYQVSAILQSHGLQPVPFKSSGGHGIHLIMLWDEPQDAYSVRALLMDALAEHGLKNGTKGLRENQVEVFPKQDALAEDGWGNMFILPLHAESAPLNPATFAEENPEHLGRVTWPLSAPVPVREKPIPSNPQAGGEPVVGYEELQAELAKVPNNDLDYDAWRNIIFAIHHATGGSAEGHAIASAWSATSSKHDQEFLDERVWPYVKHDRGGPVITIDTIRRLARQHEDPLDDFEALDPPEEAHDLDAPQAGRPATATGAAPGAPHRLKYPPIPTHEFLQRPPPRWRVPGIVPEAPLMVVFGEPASGKSFWTLDLVAHIATGMPYREREVVKTPVLYVAAEGAGGFRNRLEALCAHHELDPAALELHVVDGAPNFMEKPEVAEIIATCKELKERGVWPRVIVIDTLARVMPGGDENSSEGMGKVINNVALLAAKVHATVILIHHSGKDASRGARGWSGLYGATDQEVNITRAGDARTATISKSKDGKDGEAMPFTLPTIELARPGDTSCWVRHALAHAALSSNREPSAPRQRAAFRSLKGACEFGPIPTSDALAAIESQLPEMPADKPGSRKNRAQQALTSLIDTRWAIQLELQPGDDERRIVIGSGPNA